MEEICKEKPDCKSARHAGKFPGEVRYMQGQKDKRSWPEKEGQEECSRSQDQSERYRDEQAGAMVRELNVPQCSCFVQNERTGQRQTRCGERGSMEGSCAILSNFGLFVKVTKKKQNFPSRKMI